MRIGIDFDNTIVCYDEIFHRLAVERGLIGPDAPRGKSMVRDALRRSGREAEWTRLQGEAYGPRIGEAEVEVGEPAAAELAEDRLAARTAPFAEGRSLVHEEREAGRSGDQDAPGRLRM